MAEYAGLEIRIGGNTTKLTNALKAPTKSAAELQNRIRQITRAMQFDPTDLKNVDTRVRITGDRMQSLQSKVQLVRTAMEQLGSSMGTIGGKEKSIRDIVKDTENLSLKAKQADERFVNLGGSLAKIYEAWNKKSRDKGADFAKDQLGIDAHTADYLMRTTTSLSDFRTELNSINTARASGLMDGDIITPEQLATLTQLKELDFHGMFERGLDLDDVVKDAQNLGIVLEDSAIANVRELQKTFKEAQIEKKAFDEALKFDQMGTDAQRLDSEIESLSQNMRKLDDSLTPTTMSDDFQAIEVQIRSLDAAIGNVEGDLKRTGEAIKIDPNNLDLAKRYFDDLQQKAALSEQKVGLLNKQMDMLDDDGASEAAKGHQDLAKWIEESAEAARKAKKELSDQSAKVSNLDDQVKTLSQNIANMKGDSTLSEYSDKVQQWKTNTEKLNDAMGKLGKAEENLAAYQETFASDQDLFDKATKQADEYKAKLDELRQEYQQLQDTLGSADESVDFMSMIQEGNRLEGEISELETAYVKASREAEKFGSALSNSKENAETAQKVYNEASDKVDRLKKSVSELEKTKEVKLFKNPTGEIEKAEGELRELQGELDQAKAKENELEDAYDSAKTENELAKTAKALRDVSGDADAAKADLKAAMDEIGSKGSGIFNASTIKSMGMTLSATLTPAISAIGYKMVDASATVDSAYRDMRKTVDGTEEQFEHLRSAAIDFSRTHVTSADQLLSIEAIGGELGIATENLETFAEVISNLDVATNLNAEDAATALGHLANIMKIPEDKYSGFSDALVRLGNNGASTESEIANIAERIGSMASIVGMQTPDVLAFASTIASTGQNAEAAGTAISKTLSFMETAVSAAGGTMDTSFEAINAAVQEGGDKLTVFASLAGMTADEFSEAWSSNSEEMAADLNEQLDSAKDSLQKIADVAHMSADEFAKTWEESPTEAVKAFIDGLNDVEKSGGSADKVLSDLGITAVRQKQAIEGLMQTVGGLDDNITMSRNAWEGVSDQWGQAGDAANEAAKKAEGFSGQIQILKNMWQIFLSELGEGAAPWIKRFSGLVSSLSEGFSGLSSSTKEFVVALGGIAFAAGPVLSFFGSLGSAKKDLSNWVNETVSSTSVVKAAFKSGGQGAVDALMGTMTAMDKVKVVGATLGKSLLKGLAFGLVIAGIGLVITKLKELYDRYQEHKAATEGLSEALEGVGKASEYSGGSVESAGMKLRDLAKDSKEYEGRLANLAQTIKDSNSEYGSYAGRMDYYSSVVNDLGGKANKTAEETRKLKSALEAVNEQCGTTYGLDDFGNIIDTTTGKIQENTDVINANIEARRNQALMDYYADDYAQAVGEMTDAQANLEKARKDVSKLTSEYNAAMENAPTEGDRLNLTYDYQTKMGEAQEAIRNYSDEVKRTSGVVATLEEKMGAAQEEMDKANKVIKDAAEAEEEYNRRTETVTSDVTGNMKRMSDAVSELGKTDADFNNIAESMEAIHVSASELDNVDMGRLVSAFSDVGMSMADVISALEDGGVHMDTWNAALEAAPGAAENMSAVTGAAFQSMFDVAGQNINDTMTLIAGLDMVQVADKTFYIGDNGSIIDSQGKIYDIQNDLASIPNEVITQFYVNDEGAAQTALDTKANLEAVTNEPATATINAQDNASPVADNVQGKVDKLGASTPTPTININDFASAVISSVSSSLTSLNGKVATTYINVVKRESQATGGMNGVPVIPRHAQGYIATGPTLTNQGWIGEDGVEAVANWATGGAVVPLTNKRYMLPIADAIAAGMIERGVSGAATVNNYYVNDAIVNGDAEIQAAFLNLFDTLTRKGAMNVG